MIKKISSSGVIGAAVFGMMTGRVTGMGLLAFSGQLLEKLARLWPSIRIPHSGVEPSFLGLAIGGCVADGKRHRLSSFPKS